MNEIEKQLENLGISWFNSPDQVGKLQAESQIQNLKHSEGFSLALCNLISKPQTDESIALFLIGIMKEEAKILYSTKKKSIFGRSFSRVGPPRVFPGDPLFLE